METRIHQYIWENNKTGKTKPDPHIQLSTPHGRGIALIPCLPPNPEGSNWDKCRTATVWRGLEAWSWEGEAFNSKWPFLPATDFEHHLWLFQLLPTLKEYFAEFWNICFVCTSIIQTELDAAKTVGQGLKQQMTSYISLASLPNSSDTQIQAVFTDSEQQQAKWPSRKWVL